MLLEIGLLRLFHGLGAIQVEDEEAICEPILVFCIIADSLEQLERSGRLDFGKPLVCVGRMEQQGLDQADKHGH